MQQWYCVGWRIAAVKRWAVPAGCGVLIVEELVHIRIQALATQGLVWLLDVAVFDGPQCGYLEISLGGRHGMAGAVHCV